MTYDLPVVTSGPQKALAVFRDPLTFRFARHDALRSLGLQGPSFSGCWNVPKPILSAP